MKSVSQLDLPTDSCKKLITQIIENNFGANEYKCELSKASGVGDNYIGIIYRIVAEKTIKKDNENDKFSIIIKLPPLNEARREQFFVRPCFLREIMVYEEILPLFMNFQEKKGIIPNENGFHEVSKCYGVMSGEVQEVLIFEDLKASGFEMFDRHLNVTVEHVELVMKILGKFHAISFALKDQDFSKIEPYTKMVDIFTQRSSDASFNDFMQILTARAIATLDRDTDTYYIEKVKALFGSSFMEALKKSIDPVSAEPYAVIGHGDCWNNNVMYKNKNNVPIDARLVDWQITRYASPVCDITYYIFGCTTKEFRDIHYHDMIKVYYKSLSEYLKMLGSDPEKVFPYSALEDQLKKFGKFGLLMATLILPVITSNAEDIPDLDDISEKLQNNEDCSNVSFTSERTEDIFKKKMSDAIRDIIDLGYV